MAFKRSLGFWGMVFAAVSGMLGSGWLFAPYYTAQLAGPSSLLSWIMGAVFTLFIALTFAELTSMFPISGSQARFMEFSHGTLASLIFNLVMWLGYISIAPIETIGILQYISEYFPALIKSEHGLIILSSVGYIWATLLLLAMCILNFASMKWLARYNNIVAWLKIGMPFILVAVLCTLAFNIHNITAGAFFANGISGTGQALSSGGVIFSYIGFAAAIVLAGEAKNAQKTIPLVLTVSILICLLVYFLVQMSFLGAVSTQSLSNGWLHLSFPNDASPFLGIIQGLHLPILNHLVFVTAILAPLGTAVIFIAMTSRVTYAMSQNGYFPRLFLYLSPRGVPITAVLLNFLMGLILFFPSPGWQGMMNFLVSALVFCYAIGPISVIALRRQIPNFERRYKLPFATVWCIFSFFLSNIILYWAGWKAYLEIIIFLFFSLCVFALSWYFNPSLRSIKLNKKHSVWVFVYLFGMGLICYLGQFGGRGLIPAKIDVLIIFAFSLAIFYFAKYSALPTDEIEKNLSKINFN